MLNGVKKTGFVAAFGLTMVELLVAMGISALLITIAGFSFIRAKASYDLSQAANKLFSDLSWVRQKSMGSANLYGISFGTNSYTVFEDKNGNNSCDSGEGLFTINMGNISITFSGSPSVGGVIIYSRRGTPSRLTTITLTNQYGSTKSISVSMFNIRIS